MKTSELREVQFFTRRISWNHIMRRTRAFDLKVVVSVLRNRNLRWKIPCHFHILIILRLDNK